MKMRHPLPFFFVLLCISSAPLFSQGQKVNQLPDVLNQCNADSVHYIERLAALKFNRYINNYRLSKKEDTLVWDDTLWLAAKNHTTWMMMNNELSHIETKGTKYFTGEGPGERYNFVCSDKGECGWSGENALYNYSASGTSLNEIAENIASSSFEQWKASPGHNANMLAPQSRLHGVAFRITSDGVVWSTDLFARAPYAFDKYVSAKVDYPSAKFSTNSKPTYETVASNNTETSKNNAVVATQKKSSSSKYVKLDLNETGKTISDAVAAKLYASAVNSPRQNKAMMKAAQHHSQYVANTKSTTEQEKKSKRYYYGKTSRSRMLKASHGAFFISGQNKKLVETFAIVSADAADLNIDAIAVAIADQLKKNQNDSGSVVKSGLGITIKRTKNQLTIYADHLELVK